MKIELTFWLSLGSFADVSNSSMLWASANFSAMLEGTWESTSDRLLTEWWINPKVTLRSSAVHTNLYLVHKVALVPHQDSRYWCRHPMTIALLESEKAHRFINFGCVSVKPCRVQHKHLVSWLWKQKKDFFTFKIHPCHRTGARMCEKSPFPPFSVNK